MSTIKIVKITLASLTIGILAACSTITPTQSTLGSSAELRIAADGSQSFLKAPLRIQSEIHIADVNVALASSSNTSLSTDERVELVTELRKQLATTLANTYKVVDSPTASSFALRATITDVRTSSVAGNIVSTLILFVPADKGGAAVEFELKSPTGERIAAMSVASQAKFVQFAGAFSKLGQAKLVMADHAKSLSELLQGQISAPPKSNS